MAGVRAIFCKPFFNAIDPCFKTRLLKPLISRLEITRSASHNGKYNPSDWPQQHREENMCRLLGFSSLAENRNCKTHGRTYSITHPFSNQSIANMASFGLASSPNYLTAKFHHRTYSSHSGNKQDNFEIAVKNIVNAEASNDENTSGTGGDWFETFDHARQSVLDAALSAEKKAKDLYNHVIPHLQEFYDSHPYLEKVIVPVSGTLSATLLAWFVMPKILRKLHKYASQGPLSLFSGSSAVPPIPYEKTLWSALEDPARYLITFVAFSQLGVMIAPTAAEYLSQAWRGAVVLSFIWFLHRWKTNFFTVALTNVTNQTSPGLDRDKLLTLEKLSSVGLIILGVMGLAEALGVPVQSIVTVGGIGGVATAFAARDILGNLLSGLSLQFSKPFGVGDNIKMQHLACAVNIFNQIMSLLWESATTGIMFGEVSPTIFRRQYLILSSKDKESQAGSVEGQVMEMGLTSTSLLNPEKFPVIVPNSLFSSQVIINKSRAQWRASLTKIPLRIEDIEKIPQISEDIKSMLQAHPKVFLGNDAPFCYLSRVEYSFAELTLGCNLKSMRKDELFATEQNVLLQAVRIIRQHGAELGSSQNDGPNFF